MLLIVVAFELGLAAGGCGLYAVLDPCPELLPAIISGVLLLLGQGVLLLRTAIRALSSRLHRPYQAGDYVSALGVICGVLSVFVTWLLVIAVQERATVAGEKVIVHIAATVVAWANTSALVVAGYFLRRYGKPSCRWSVTDS